MPKYLMEMKDCKRNQSQFPGPDLEEMKGKMRKNILRIWLDYEKGREHLTNKNYTRKGSISSADFAAV